MLFCFGVPSRAGVSDTARHARSCMRSARRIRLCVMPRAFAPATRPTMYFIGVTTGRSSINAVFPRWAERLGLGDVELRGCDLALHDEPANYRAVVEFIKNDPLSLGALVTTHKLDLFAACGDLFDRLDPLTRSLAEVSSIYKRDGELHGRAIDPWNAGRALAAFLPGAHWRSGAEAFILGAGGAGTALARHLNNTGQGAERPRRIHVVDRSEERLAHLQRLHGTWREAPLECHLTTTAAQNDRAMERLPAGSLVVNATGMGKDLPGSPLSDAAVFPERGIAWEFNYRGDLVFLRQARAQQTKRSLHIEDGWVYFLHGWTSVIADVFACDIPPRGGLFDDLGEIAGRMR